MGYNTKLADRVRVALAYLPDVEEKEMFRGVCFMVNGKMCVCVSEDELLCRIGAEAMQQALDENGVRQMVMARDRPSKDFVYVGGEAFYRPADFDKWIRLALDFNPK